MNGVKHSGEMKRHDLYRASCSAHMTVGLLKQVDDDIFNCNLKAVSYRMKLYLWRMGGGRVIGAF